MFCVYWDALKIIFTFLLTIICFLLTLTLLSYFFNPLENVPRYRDPRLVTNFQVADNYSHLLFLFFFFFLQPVNLFPPTSAGFCDVFGNVWEWVEDHFNGLPGYKSHYIYDDFSAPCFDGRHHLIMVRITSQCVIEWEQQNEY